MPVLPLYDVLRWEEGVKDIQVQRIEVNWFNHVENIVDVSHLAWLHGYTFPSYGGKKVRYNWDRTSYGANNVMHVEGIEDKHVSCYGFPTVNGFTLPPIDKSGEHVRSIIIRVPENDVSTLLYFVRFYKSDKRSLNTSIRECTYGEYAPLASDWWGINVNDQDRMAVEQQGVVADRPNEHLAVSDGGIIEMRKMMRESLAAIAAGQRSALRHPRPGKTENRLPAQRRQLPGKARRCRLCPRLWRAHPRRGDGEMTAALHRSAKLRSVRHAERRRKPAALPYRPRHADGRDLAPLLASGRPAPSTLPASRCASKSSARSWCVYRGAGGKPVLMEGRCAHRSLALDYGRVEGDCLRCPYHGWLYDSSGQCLEQPAEPEGSGFKDKVRLQDLPCRGSERPRFSAISARPRRRCLPLYDVLRMEDGAKGIQLRNVNANWLNHVENIVDISHLAWLHGHSFPAYGAKKVTYRWDRRDYGVDNIMLVDGVSDDDTHVSCYGFPTVNRFNVPPVTPGGPQVRSLLYRVPVDDESTLALFRAFLARREAHTAGLAARWTSQASTSASTAIGGVSTIATRIAWRSSSKASSPIVSTSISVRRTAASF